jgi:hypothetical protein
MGFYWKDKKDQVSFLSFDPVIPSFSVYKTQLFVRRGNLPDHDASSPDQWTSIEMALRDATPIPTPFDFTRFLASSITFMAYLSEVSVYFDNTRLARLTKSSGVPKALELPKDFKNISPMKIMNVTGIRATRTFSGFPVWRIVTTCSPGDFSSSDKSRGFATGLLYRIREIATISTRQAN